MTDDVARAAFEEHIWPEAERHHGAPMRMSDGRYPAQGIQAHWETWLAAWNARVRCGDRASKQRSCCCAPTLEGMRNALNVAAAFIEDNRAVFIECCTLTGDDGLPDMSTINDVSASGLAEYDAVLASIRAALAPAKGDE